MTPYRLPLRLLLLLALPGVALIGCELDDDDDPPPPEEEEETAEVEDASLFGRWKGTAGTDQVPVTLEMQGPALGTDVYGTLTWPGGDVRSVHGWYPHNSGSENIYPSPSSDIDARLEISTDGDPDLWDLVIEGSSMTGSGRKAGGASYGVNLAKQ